MRRTGRRHIVVCGGGAAGVAAALSAARSGCVVTLVERAPRVGGTVAHVLIHTIGGLLGPSGSHLNDGLPRELAEGLQRRDPLVRPRRMGDLWVLSTPPETYLALVEEWLLRASLLRVLTSAEVLGIETRRDRVVRVEIAYRGNKISLWPDALVDATGSGAVARLLPEATVLYPSKPAAAGLVLRVRGPVAADAAVTRRGLGATHALRRAAEQGRLPAAFTRAWVDEGLYADEIFIKLAVCERDPSCGALCGTALESFLRTTAPEAHVTAVGRLGERASGTVLGDYVLRGDDVRSGRRFPDAACRAAWPIEQWHPDGSVTVERLPPGTIYEIPLRALRVQGVRNVWTAGRSLSATPSAQASARIAGACWAMGDAVGREAAAS